MNIQNRNHISFNARVKELTPDKQLGILLKGQHNQYLKPNDVCIYQTDQILSKSGFNTAKFISSVQKSDNSTVLIVEDEGLVRNVTLDGDSLIFTKPDFKEHIDNLQKTYDKAEKLEQKIESESK